MMPSQYILRQDAYVVILQALATKTAAYDHIVVTSDVNSLFVHVDDDGNEITDYDADTDPAVVANDDDINNKDD